MISERSPRGGALKSLGISAIDLIFGGKFITKDIPTHGCIPAQCVKELLLSFGDVCRALHPSQCEQCEVLGDCGRWSQRQPQTAGFRVSGFEPKWRTGKGKDENSYVIEITP